MDKADLGKPESEDEICEEIATEPEAIEDDDVVVESVLVWINTFIWCYERIDFFSSKPDDGSDTEDEIERIQTLQQTNQKKKDDEIGDLLENFFQTKTFHVDRVIDYKDRELITRYIIAYSG